jgi:3-oxoacyl-[acyl-carrier-protein] synthase-3
MAGATVEGVSIAGIASAVPETVKTLRDIEAVFGKEQTQRIAKSAGVLQSHVATDDICASDLCYFAAERLLAELGWDRNSIDVLVLVTVTPDYITPTTACTLQHRLKLSKACAALDISHGCSGYVYGLWVLGQMMSHGNAKRALLLVGDTLTRLTSPYDRTTSFVFGDAGTATALEVNDSAAPMYFDLGSDGSGAAHIIVKAGQSRVPATPETRKRTERESGNLRSDEDLYLDGLLVFALMLKELPDLFDRVLARSKWSRESIDAIVMAQANLFVTRHLGKKMSIPEEKLIKNLADYGDTGAATIPLGMTEKLRERLTREHMRLVLLGFGTGLSWAGVSLTCGPIVVPEIVKVRPLAGEQGA